MARGSYLAGMMRSSVLGAALLAGAALPAYAASDITIAGSATLTTDYVFRGITQTAGNPAIQGEFDFTYAVKQFPSLFYFTIWSSNLDFGGGPTGQQIAPIEIDWDAGIRPTWGKWTFDFGSLYYSYPGSCEPHVCGLTGHPAYWELKTGVSRNLFSDKLALSLTNYWSPDTFGQTGRNNVLEFDAGWTFNKVWYFTPNIGGVVGRQWGTQSEGGFDYTYWNVGLNLGFNNKPALALDLRYWDTSGIPEANCPNEGESGTFACGARIVGSFTAKF
jgi:uncharacterized protein (TIGR02001 family)